MIELAALVLLAASLLLLRRTAVEQSVYELAFPRTVRPTDVTAALRSIAGLLPPWWRRALRGVPVVTLEVRATSEGVSYRLAVASAHAEQVVAQLRGAIAGLRAKPAMSTEPLELRLVRELRPVGAGSLRTDAIEQSTTGLLASLQPLLSGEGVVVQYAIAPHAPSHPAQEGSSAAAAREPLLSVAIRVGVAGPPARVAQLMARVLGAFHGAGSPDGALRRRILPSALAADAFTRLRGRPRQVLRADALAAVSPFPVAGPPLPGLSYVGSRTLPPSRAIPTSGLVLGTSVVAPERGIAISPDEARRGVHICAPTGAGKSTLLINLSCQLMAAGGPLVVIDSKGDLARDVAARVPRHRTGDALLFDPADSRPLGFNVLGGASEAELVVEHVVGQFRSRYGASGLGPRSEDILRAALLTLAKRREFTLVEVEPLLSNRAFRQRLIANLDEPVLEGFWAWFNSLSDAARAEAVGPLANKLRTFTLSRRVRTVIGQSEGVDLGRVLSGRGILIVSLARGVVGDDAAALIGAAMVSRLWHVIQGRAAIPAEERVPATIICDEFQDFAGLPLAFETAIAQSRGYGVGWVLAHQNLAQLDARLRQAVLANCRSRFVMQTTASDAAVFAREFAPLVEAADLQGLPAYEGYAAVATGAAVAPPASVRTLPAPAPTGTLESVRERSRTLGASSDDVERQLRSRTSGPTSRAPIGGRSRS